MGFQSLLTLPGSVANGEHRFSKLKLIKLYLCSSSKLQDSLVELAADSIEGEIVSELCLKQLIGQFEKAKVGKAVFWMFAQLDGSVRKGYKSFSIKEQRLS